MPRNTEKLATVGTHVFCATGICVFLWFIIILSHNTIINKIAKIETVNDPGTRFIPNKGCEFHVRAVNVTGCQEQYLLNPSKQLVSDLPPPFKDSSDPDPMCDYLKNNCYGAPLPIQLFIMLSVIHTVFCIILKGLNWASQF